MTTGGSEKREKRETVTSNHTLNGERGGGGSAWRQWLQGRGERARWARRFTPTPPPLLLLLHSAVSSSIPLPYE
eukprot:3224335-Pyramimonas_sp.AAC.1